MQDQSIFAESIIKAIFVQFQFEPQQPPQDSDISKYLIKCMDTVGRLKSTSK